EMLGNFAIGDYWKKEAIEWGWELLTTEFGLDPNTLVATVHKDDDEAYDIWVKELKLLPAEKVFKLGDEFNTWSLGPTGLYGPDSEVFIDKGPQPGVPPHECDPSENCGRYIEIWNYVFQQYERKPDGTLVPLPKKNIDTGGGLERLAQVLQGVPGDTYRTDLFQPLVKEETKFEKTLANGLAMLNEAIDRAKAQGQTFIDGDTTFRLYDTYGFPIEMTEEIASGSGMTVDEDRFRDQLEAQRSRSRASAKFSQDARKFGQFYAILKETDR